MRLQRQSLVRLPLHWTALLVFLSISTQGSASQPGFRWPDDTAQERQEAIQQAFRDALILARVVAVTFDSCEEVVRLPRFVHKLV